MVPCGAFEAGEAGDNQVARARVGPIAAFAMRDAFVLRNLCDGPTGPCRVDRLDLPQLSAGSQVMLTTAGHYLVGIDHDDGRVQTYEFDDEGRFVENGDEPELVDQEQGPAKLVIGLRDSDSLIVRDRRGRLAVFEPTASKAIPIAPELSELMRLAAVGEHHVAVKVPRADGRQTLYLVDLGNTDNGPRRPADPFEIATGDFTSIVIGPGDGTLVVSEGSGTEATVLVFDVRAKMLVDAFEGEVVSARQENQRRALEEVPGLHAVSPSGDQLAYRTTSGALAVRQLGTQSSCLVRNTNRLGTARQPTRDVGNHDTAGFSADGIIYAEYNVGASDSYVYAYDPRQQQIVPLGNEEGGWHLSAVPGR
ncbi:MAG: hypothetical protein AB1Z98_33645, partial [Nannocystaceae bacterium]